MNRKEQEQNKEIKEISKVKFDGKEVKINYSKQIKEGEYVNCEFTSKDLPHPDFIGALASIKQDFMEILEFNPGYSEKLEVRGISVKLSDFLVPEGITVTGLKELGSGKFVCINTPYLAYGDDNFEFPRTFIEKVQDLKNEAFKYIEGKRKNKQLKLVS